MNTAIESDAHPQAGNGQSTNSSLTISISTSKSFTNNSSNNSWHLTTGSNNSSFLKSINSNLRIEQLVWSERSQS